MSLRDLIPMNLLSAKALSVAIAVALESSAADLPPSWLDAYHVVWTEPATRALDSMPAGGGNIALNVWTTRDDLLFYIASPDSWNGRTQVKMGRVRVTLSPNPFGHRLRQELKLADNSIHVSGQAADGTEVKLCVWVDALQPVVHIEGTSSKPIQVKAAIEMIGGAQGSFDRNAAVWCFRIDGPSPQRRDLVGKNHVEAIAAAVPDPMANHTWGGRLSGTGFVAGTSGEAENEGIRTKAWSIETATPVTAIDLRATLRIAQDPSLDAWKQEVAALETRSLPTAANDREKTRAWWREFWGRSHIVINPGRNVEDPAWEAGRNYQLFRAMLAANRNGRMPTLFNGGPYLMEANPNERQWEHAGFTAQNQRLVHWPMLKSGDADLLKVGLDFYKDRHALAIAWAKHFWNIRGAVFPEDIDLFGLPVYTTKDGSGHTAPDCLRYHYVSCIEFALMMLQSGSYFGTDVRPYVPVADGILRFFDQFYRSQHKQATGRELDANGHLAIHPGNAVEAFSGTTNDAPTAAGLIALTDALLALPANVVTAGQLKFWKSFRATLPPVPTRVWRGRRLLAPAGSWAAQRPDFNMELPHLYPVFPFRLYGVGLPDLDVARNAWFYGDTCPAKQKNSFCWYQAGIFSAGLGLTDIAREYALARLLHPRMGDPVEHDGWKSQASMSPWELRWTRKDWQLPRYPAFWDGMIFCGRPDMDHGGAAMVQLQEMLLQTPGDPSSPEGSAGAGKLHLFPAWPKEWDVDFKLHAPGQTVVEATLRNGALANLKVTPEARAKDVVNWLGKQVPWEPLKPRVPLTQGRPVKASSQYSEPGYEAARANDGDIKTRWASDSNARSGWLVIDLGDEQEVGGALISEIEWPGTLEFAIEVPQGDSWKQVAHGTTIGQDKEVSFTPVKTRRVRLHVLKAKLPLNINEFQVFAPEPAP